MRGYLSFVLVLLCLLILLSLLQAREASMHIDLSKAVMVERAYSISMNIKECVLEAARAGAADGFAAYDHSHDVRLCRHCADSYCSIIPIAVNRCDQALCSQCFREQEARAEAESGALSRMALLGPHAFDSDFSIGLSFPGLRAITRADVSGKNGYALDSLIFEDEVRISAESTKLGISAESKIPRGVVIAYEGADQP